MDIHETRLGRTFFEGHVPKIMRALESIAVELKRANDLKELELEMIERSESCESQEEIQNNL